MLFTLVLMALGLTAYYSLGRQEDPTIVSTYATVTTYFPGADPGRVETLVSTVIEDELRTMPEIEQVSSLSVSGVSIITLGLRDTVRDDDIDNIWAEIRDLLEDTETDLPEEASSPDFEILLGAYTLIVALTLDERTGPAGFLSNYAEELASRFRGVLGSKKVTIFGAPEEEVLVSVDPRIAAELGLDARQISAVISAADSKVQAGRYRTSGSQMNINVQGEIKTLDRLRQIVLKKGADGHLIQLGDIATISRQTKTPASEAASFDGRPAVLVAAKIADGLQIGTWLNEINNRLADFRQLAPTGLKATVVFDQSDYTYERLRDVSINMFIGVTLVIVVLFFTMGLREALIVAFVLPVVGLASLATLQIFNVPIQQMSVTGLIVSLGLLVDAAIVMTDDIGRRLKAGEDRLSAVQAAVTHLFAPLLASTLTTVFAFLPMILLPGPAGDFLSSIAIAVAAMVLWSFVIAVTVTPAVSGWFLADQKPSRRHFANWAATALGGVFKALITLSLCHPLKSIVLAAALPTLGFAAFPGLKAQFFPSVKRDQFYIEVELQPGSKIENSLQLARRIDKDLRATPGIETTVWTIGRSAPSFYYNMVSVREGTPEFAQALVKTQSEDHTAALLVELQHSLSRSYPTARILVRELVQGPPVDAPVELRLIGPETDVLSVLGNQIRRVLMTLEGVTAVRASSEIGAAQLDLKLDEAVVEQLGLDLTGVARQLDAALDGTVGGTLVSGLRQLDVRVKLAGSDIEDERLWQTQIIPGVRTEAAQERGFTGIPLLSIAEPELNPAERVIARRNGERVNRIYAYLEPGLLPQYVNEQAMERLQETGFVLPPGYRVEIGGDSDARRITIENLQKTFPVVMILSAAIIVLSLNSFRLSLVVGVVAVFSIGLSLLALEVFRYPFGINAIIGVIGSIGIAVNAALIILSSLKEHDAARGGNVDAMAGVVCASARHITSTTVTTIGGFLPLMMEGGGFWPPFATAISGGVALSTIVSFFFVPPMFKLLADARQSSRDIAARS